MRKPVWSQYGPKGARVFGAPDAGILRDNRKAEVKAQQGSRSPIDHCRDKAHTKGCHVGPGVGHGEVKPHRKQVAKALPEQIAFEKSGLSKHVWRISGKAKKFNNVG
jgi:hypothetical protein